MKQSFDLSESGKTARVARMSAAIVGFSALMWFLLRVIPKPSRATYPCQRAAFPVASAFVIWLCASMAGLFSLSGLRTLVRRYRWAAVSLCVLTVAVGSIWLAHFRAIAAAEIATRYNS
ncbi:MAG: hypothetical protein WB425_18235 [Terracidiphilus sp.]